MNYSAHFKISKHMLRHKTIQRNCTEGQKNRIQKDKAFTNLLLLKTTRTDVTNSHVICDSNYCATSSYIYGILQTHTNT